jgi:aromatic-L-amino-acid/L-tryptophan decarboxylase
VVSVDVQHDHELADHGALMERRPRHARAQEGSGAPSLGGTPPGGVDVAGDVAAAASSVDETVDIRRQDGRGVRTMPEGDGPGLGDWSCAEFQRRAEEVTALIADYFGTIRSRPVARTVDPRDLLESLDTPLPEAPEDFSAILADTSAKILPNLTHWNHPSFHAYFSISSSFAGMLAELLTSALDSNAMVWQAAQAASTLELIVLRWVAELAGYPASAEGVLLNGASLGTFYALVAARDALGFDIRTRGMTAEDVPPLRIYTSDQAHSSVDKAGIALGVGLANVVRVPTDGAYAMRRDLLEAAIDQDASLGRRALAVVGTVGTTTTGSSDRIAELAAVCARRGIWLHVDAAYGGLWNLVPAVRSQAEDLTLADSVVVNPHKCLYVPLEVSCLYTMRPGALEQAFRLVPEYLRTDDASGSVDFMNRSLQLGRSFRALKLWWVIRSFGRAGIEARMSESIRLAEWLREAVRSHPDFECPVTSLFPLVCLRYVPRELAREWGGAGPERREAIGTLVDNLNAELLARLNAGGSALASHGVVREGRVVRVSIGNIRTSEQDVRHLWQALRGHASTIGSASAGVA